ncbi:MAG: restriction endonuclease subunit M, partial [Anaerolineaceae bacterium 4572_32.2]
MTPPNQVLQLIERFERNLAHYKQAGYKETEVRVEFIDPFFEALGWDIHNRQGRGELDKDVVHEDAIRVGGKTLAPDYSFRVGRARKFFLEAKKPAVSLKGDVGPAYQLRRYSWSVKLPLGVLTDFEEFAVYDCRQRPKPGDKAAVGRLMYITFDQYRERWNEIYEIFAKESVQQGSFDAYAQQTKTKRGSSEVDAELLKEIEGWRDVLARNIALRNGALSVYELNFCVQRTIDRIIFLRMCEDRGIEEYGQLLALTNGPHVYARLGEYYRRADEKYNAGLFDFTADTLTRSLLIDDKALKPILSSLYYPQCPYEFSVLPVEILGQVYEQFLGKVIRLTAGHRAKVEEKPEVKKAGGVYYTPSYIVDYIVSQTVGKLVQGKTPRQISKLRVLDPACGSGSFLLGAYQYLLDYHRQWYEDNDPAKHARRKQPAVYQASGGDWRLTGAEKKRILLNNIYGVDIDRQAVEVTKLSLLLQVLEGETEETLGQQLSLWRERALPDLGENIKCGNSLIGPDYFEAQLMPDEEEMRRVNPFDWESGFPEVMAAGGPSAGSGQGFDCVVGNPPYIRIQTMKEWAPTEVEFYKQQYAAASKGNYDIYVVFVERALQLLNERGRMGYILPHKFFQAKYGQPLRQLLAEGKHLAEVVHFGDQQVFTGASTYTCLLFLDKKGNQQFHYAKAHDLDAWRAAQTSEVSEDLGGLEGEIRADKVTEKEWNFVVGPGAPLFERLSKMPIKLGDITNRIFQGLKTGADKVYIVDEIERKAKQVKIFWLSGISRGRAT